MCDDGWITIKSAGSNDNPLTGEDGRENENAKAAAIKALKTWVNEQKVKGKQTKYKKLKCHPVRRDKSVEDQEVKVLCSVRLSKPPRPRVMGFAS